MNSNSIKYLIYKQIWAAMNGCDPQILILEGKRSPRNGVVFITIQRNNLDD